ncbi:radical SAM family heme chaperone HemW [Frigoriflavimonas asaccharolytica]|uniref:Heme chaperone HemW n=1 Tax=Frigoriflavimonas asaccharolytica TaxID=2735899 RepID=A0A8J8K7V7_9FLAO|nr:radical SAM family heme chaperone HemW [Frigoriflavimonas asaccharolytica]NRS91352.1 oxygen-independent coproporphyrinogen-3 oxidase [Frigoriflavimonas asaccharolytica]
MIYIHIPFCKQKCSYCNFHFSTSTSKVDEMVNAIKKEIYLRKDELQNKSLASLYFGGGTPSILKVDHLKSIIDEVSKYFEFQNDIEITLEANPDDLNKKFLQELSSTEFNRLSIGTQSFFEEDLKLMNRAHTSNEALDSIKRSQDFGFENLSVDLIYGSPSSSFLNWQQNLKTIIDLQVPHVSSYALTVEPKTAMENWVKTGKMEAPKDDFQNEAYFYMTEFLKENNFQHYEISNFGKESFQSRHNTAYWQSREYLGIGPSAHSYDGNLKRSWNIANNSIYLDKISANTIPSEVEILSEKEQLNEMLMIGLRTSWGVSLAELKNRFSLDLIEKITSEIEFKIEEGILLIENDYLKIPEKHWFLADGIVSDLFLI